jgi:hypothetical protein
VDEDWMTIAEAAARCGLPESTLRYWERTDAGGVAAYALDPEAAERLWAVSGQMNQ